jgi:CheY-like chemotaxis protein
LKQLFSSIIQFNSGELQQGGGSGIGLFVCKGIMDLHGGAIGASSAGLGQGTTFFIDIPIDEDTPMERARCSSLSSSASDASSSSSPAGSSSSAADEYVHVAVVPLRKMADTGSSEVFFLEQQTSSDSLSCLHLSTDDGLSTIAETGSSSNTAMADDTPGMFVDDEQQGNQGADAPAKKETSPTLNVLVVDDSKPARKMIARFLQSIKVCASPAHAANGIEAVELIAESMRSGAPFDAVLMDYSMPRMDGETASRHAREMGFKGFIIGVTGHINDDIPDMMHSGVDKVTHKPMDTKLLEQMMLKILKHRRSTTPDTGRLML